jgi:uncharacterized membrane protein
MPTGLILSAIVACILVVTGWLGGELVFRHRIGVAAEGPGHGEAAGRHYAPGPRV